MLVEHSYEDSDESTADRITRQLTAICVVLRAQAWKAATIEGLTPTQCYILILLNEGSITPQPAAVAKALAVTRPSAGQAIDSLVRKGLVDRDAVQTNRRDKALTLTPKGQEVAARASGYSAFLAEAAAALAPNEQEGLLALLVKLTGNLPTGGSAACSAVRPLSG
jgi:DNA-binding MarR family transcriptional regulator